MRNSTTSLRTAAARIPTTAGSTRATSPCTTAAMPPTVPAALRSLAPGVHDDVMVDGVERVVLVREVDGRPVMLALDITDLEQREFDMGADGGRFGGHDDRAARHRHRLERQPPGAPAAATWRQDIARLQPDQPGQRIDVPDVGQRRTGRDRRCAQRLPAAQRSLRRARAHLHRQRQPRTAHADRGDRRRQRDRVAAARRARRRRAASSRASSAPRATSNS